MLLSFVQLLLIWQECIAPSRCSIAEFESCITILFRYSKVYCQHLHILHLNCGYDVVYYISLIEALVNRGSRVWAFSATSNFKFSAKTTSHRFSQVPRWLSHGKLLQTTHSTASIQVGFQRLLRILISSFLLQEYNDTLLMTYLATITKCSRYVASSLWFRCYKNISIAYWNDSVACSTINELVDKFNTAYDKQNRRGGRTTFIWSLVRLV